MPPLPSDARAGLIRPARVDEVDALNALTGRSCLHWGYEPAFLDWEPHAITVYPEMLDGAERAGGLDRMQPEALAAAGPDPVGVDEELVEVERRWLGGSLGRELAGEHVVADDAPLLLLQDLGADAVEHLRVDGDGLRLPVEEGRLVPPVEARPAGEGVEGVDLVEPRGADGESGLW